MSAKTKLAKLVQAKHLYQMNPEGITDIEMAQELGVARTSAYLYRQELGAVLVSEGKYTIPSDLVWVRGIVPLVPGNEIPETSEMHITGIYRELQHAINADEITEWREVNYPDSDNPIIDTRLFVADVPNPMRQAVIISYELR